MLQKNSDSQVSNGKMILTTKNYSTKKGKITRELDTKLRITLLSMPKR
jgi:hypothetical protein